MADFIFFYGTLLPQHAPPNMRSVLIDLRPRGEGSVRGRLFDFGAHPGAVLSDSAKTRVFGKVFQLPEDDAVLAKLDEYEGFDPSAPDSDWFVRKRVTVSMDDGSLLPCWIYEYKGDATGLPIIASGRFAHPDVSDG